MLFKRNGFMSGVVIGACAFALMKWAFGKKSRGDALQPSGGKNATFSVLDDCLLFSPTLHSAPCRIKVGYCDKFYCSSCNYKRFIALIQSTKLTLDICVYLITSDELTDAIINLFVKGIYIRILMDRQMARSRNSKFIFFHKKRIPIKVIEGLDEVLMHNKFVIIDQKVLITGSFNWTAQAFTKNFENGLVIHNKIIVEKYSLYYESLWKVVSSR